MCGAAGTGKTSNRARFLADAGITSSYVYLNPDNLGGNQTLLTNLLHRCVKENYSFMFDATCRNRQYITSVMKKLYESRYKIILFMTYASLDTALDRIKKRVEQPVPQEVVRDIYKHMQKNAETYMNVRYVDELFLYNNEHTSKLIYQKNKKSVRCILPGEEFYFDVSKYCPKE